jgi:hypothetical protein
MGAFGEFKVVVSDDGHYVEGETYDIVLNADQSYNEYDGTANEAKAAAAAPVPDESTEAPAEAPADESQPPAGP